MKTPYEITAEILKYITSISLKIGDKKRTIYKKI